MRKTRKTSYKLGLRIHIFNASSISSEPWRATVCQQKTPGNHMDRRESVERAKEKSDDTFEASKHFHTAKTSQTSTAFPSFSILSSAANVWILNYFHGNMKRKISLIWSPLIIKVKYVISGALESPIITVKIMTVFKKAFFLLLLVGQTDPIAKWTSSLIEPNLLCWLFGMLKPTFQGNQLLNGLQMVNAN